MQVWRFPDLGMDVTLWDRSLCQSYELPYSNGQAVEPRPDPAALAGRSDLVSLAAGRGVFRAMAPGAHPMAVTGAVSRFPGADGARVLAHVFAPGEPTDSLWGSWALVASDGRVAARGSHALSISACDPTRLQVADFAAEVPPGDYRVDLAVRGSGGRRGVAHVQAHVAPISGTLRMSDLVLLCGERGTAVDPQGVRIEPNASGRVSGTSGVTVYYELDGLATDAGGTARFAYTCRVRPVPGHGPSVSATPYEATREEENVGSHRRQLVSVPAGPLAPGAYELQIEVRDLRSGETIAGSTGFVKGGPRRPR
jgi:hypothetical protein